MTSLAQTEQRTMHLKILGCGVGGRVVDGDSRADQVDDWRVVGHQELVYNSSALRGWTPGRSWNTWRPRLLSLPLAKGDYPRKTNSQPIMKTRMIKVNLLVLRVVNLWTRVI